MKIEFVSKDITLTDEMKWQIERQFTKFEKLLQKPYSVRVEVEPKKDHQVKVELVIEEKQVYKIKAYSDSIRNAIDEIENKMYRTLRKSKEKRITNKRKRNKEHEIFQDFSEPMYKIKEFPIKPLSVKEAISELNKLNRSLYVFFNEDTNNVEVVHWKNEEIELIRLI